MSQIRSNYHFPFYC